MEMSAKEELDAHGYTIINSNIPAEIIKSAQLAFLDIFEKGRSKKYPFVRVYDDYLGKLNISGIEMVFHPEIRSPEIMSFLDESGIPAIAHELLGENIKMSLSRYHITRQYSHIGNWHRDAAIKSRDSIQCSMFLFDEKGFQLIPASQDREFTDEENKILEKSVYSDLPGEKLLSAKAGQILVFRPSIIHRGMSENSRANIHFRFETDPSAEKDVDFKMIPELSGDWNKILANKNSEIISKAILPYKYPEGLFHTLQRAIRLFVHYFVFFMPYNSKIYKGTTAYPSLKIKRFFRLYK